MAGQHKDDCLSASFRLQQTEFVGVLCSLRATGHARREKLMVCRKGQLKEREAGEETVAFTEECLRRIGNRHVRSLRSDGNSGLCGVCSYQDYWAERARLEEKTRLAKMLWMGRKTSLQAFLLLFSLTHQL